MINLLPHQIKKQNRAARANVLLVRYLALLGVSTGFLILAVVAVYFMMMTIKSNAEQVANENQARIANYAIVEAEAAQFRSNLATAKAVFDKEVLYTKAMTDIARILPAGVVLENLSLDSATFGSSTTLNAKAKSYADAISLKNQLESSELFSDVHFAAISAEATDTQEPDPYPYTITINLTINKEIASR